MCFSKNLSLLSFIFGIASSLLLIFFGNKESSDTNKAIGYFFIFVSFMQFIEYLIWSDIDCKKGLNMIGSVFGPIFNHLQPICILILCTIFLKSSYIIPNKILIFINAIYLLYVVYEYYIYIIKDRCIKKNKYGHLDWIWKYNFNYIFYYVISFINIINFYKNINLIISVIVSYFLLVISIFEFHENIGELWCLMVTGIPLVNLFVQRVLGINN